MTTAIVLAAGSASRFASSCPESWNGERRKVHLEVEPGLAMWRVSFEKFRAHPEIDSVGIVCARDEQHEFSSANADFIVEGGATRGESCLAGVRAAEGADYVLVHDAARPFLSSELISRVLSATREFGAAIPVLPVVDTVKRGGDIVYETVDRRNLFTAQTPQGSRRDWLLEALEKGIEATDEAAALEAAGRPVYMVPGEAENEKITEFADFARVTARLYAVHPRVGVGYDVHPFSREPERPLMLGGVHFEGEAGLAGHSDGDAVLHAVTDALLGAIGRGDIGELFPDTDERWKGADSRQFVREAGRLVRSEAGEIGSLDVTVLAERPRIGAKREDMRRAIAEELQISESKVNIKATTAEGLGAIGRGEGIAAMAVATVYIRIRRQEN